MSSSGLQNSWVASSQGQGNSGVSTLNNLSGGLNITSTAGSVAIVASGNSIDLAVSGTPSAPGVATIQGLSGNPTFVVNNGLSVSTAGQTIVLGYTAPPVAVQSVLAGTNITSVVNDAGAWTVNAPNVPVQSVLAGTNITSVVIDAGAWIVNAPNPPAVPVQSILAGTNITSVVNNKGAWTINANNPPVVPVQSVLAGDYITSVVNDAGAWTINANKPPSITVSNITDGTNTTVSNVGTVYSVNAVVPVQSIVGGTNTTVSNNPATGVWTINSSIPTYSISPTITADGDIDPVGLGIGNYVVYYSTGNPRTLTIPTTSMPGDGWFCFIKNGNPPGGGGLDIVINANSPSVQIGILHQNTSTSNSSFQLLYYSTTGWKLG